MKDDVEERSDEHEDDQERLDQQYEETKAEETRVEAEHRATKLREDQQDQSPALYAALFDPLNQSLSVAD